MVEVLANYVFFPYGIYALLSLLIIFALFFLKKKTTITKLPTMMFLLKQQGKKKYRWFPRIPFNLLLLLYLLIATIMVLAIMEPFYQTNASDVQKHTIHIIDNSASMQTQNRFEDAIENAKSLIGTQTTIIVTSPKPQVVLEKGSYLQARTTLNNLKVTDATTPLRETIQFAQSQGYENAALHVHSDFLDNTATPSEIEELLSSLHSLIVVPHTYTQGKNTYGFVEAKYGKDEVTLLVRNFNTIQETPTLTIGDTIQELKIQANDIVPITFDLPTEPIKVTLTPADEINADNIFYLSAPAKIEKSLLYVTEKPYVYTTSMLEVLDFLTYDTYSPPGAITTSNYDAFIIEDVDPSKLLPSNINDALEKVYEGGVLVIKMGNQLRKIDIREEYPFQEILPKKRNVISFINTKITDGLTAASEEEVFPVIQSPNSTILIQTVDNEPVVVYKRHGQGGILYYGITDGASAAQFKQTYAYPILFQRVFKQNFNIPSLSEQQKQTGEQWIGNGIVNDPANNKIELPTTLSKTGFYTYQGATYAVNLLSILESQSKVENDVATVSNSASDSKVRASLLIPIVIILVLLMLIELFYLKKRGDY